MPQVLTLNYAVPDQILDAGSRKLFRQMFYLSILSGLCVLAAVFALSGNVLLGALHILVFSVTILIAFQTGGGLLKLAPSDNHRTRMVLDLLALIGLIMITIAPIGYIYLYSRSLEQYNRAGAFTIGIAYLLMAGTTYRHLLLYRLLAQKCREVSRIATARGLLALGWTKMIYEAIWLGCCGTTLLLIGLDYHKSSEDIALNLAFAALFGTMGFGVVWIWMIVQHALLLRLAKKVSPRLTSGGVASATLSIREGS